MVFKWFSKRAPDWRQRGNAALASGDLALAAKCYLEGTQPAPGDPVAWLNLAFTQLELAQHDTARASLQQAELLFPKGDARLADVWCLAGRERQESGDSAAAAAAYGRAVECAPGNNHAWHELGKLHEAQGRLQEAEACLQRAVALRTDSDLALRDLARVLVQLNRSAEAVSWIERYVQKHPHDAEGQLMHAHALFHEQRHAQALQACDRALAISDGALAMNFRGSILAAMGSPAEALACHEAALVRDAVCINALNDAAGALIHLHRYEEALAHLETLLAIEPGRREALVNKSVALSQLLRCREALAVLEDQLGAGPSDPDNAFRAGILRLQMGEWEQGWPAYELRWQLSHAGRPHRKTDFGVPQWQGEPLSGRTILLYAEQGAGDSIQFLRFVSQLAAQAGRVWLRVHEPLWPLLGDMAPNCGVVAGDLPAGVDYVCPLMSLPGILGTRVDRIAGEVPYLWAPPDALAKWCDRLGPAQGPRIGLVWSGNPDHTNDRNRSIPLARLHSAAPAGVEFISLQNEVRAGDAAALHAWPQLRHFGAELQSFGDTAALATLVDAVVSVDTSVAHLAGALARPLSILLAYCPDWRWLLERDTTSWYPTARLYRQQRPGDWTEALERAMSQLPGARVG